MCWSFLWPELRAENLVRLVELNESAIEMQAASLIGLVGPSSGCNIGWPTRRKRRTTTGNI